MISELLIRVVLVTEAGDESPCRIDVYTVPAGDGVREPRAIGSLNLLRGEIAKLRGLVDALLPQLLPKVAIVWSGAPAADAELAGGVVKRIGKVVSLARSLNLLPT